MLQDDNAYGQFIFFTSGSCWAQLPSTLCWHSAIFRLKWIYQVKYGRHYLHFAWQICGAVLLIENEFLDRIITWYHMKNRALRLTLWVLIFPPISCTKTFLKTVSYIPFCTNLNIMGLMTSEFGSSFPVVRLIPRKKAVKPACSCLCGYLIYCTHFT